MDDEEFVRRVRELRGAGRSPKEIARALGAKPATVAAQVRALAAEQARSAPEPDVVGCWVSPGWSEGLGVDGHPEWPDAGSPKSAISGVVSVLVAREHRRVGKVSVCGYLADCYCLGVKNALGPRVIDVGELRGFVRLYFDAYDAAPVEAPIELARELVFGAARYARGLGFEPHRDFQVAAGHLGSPPESSAIRFGCEGRPYYVQGPYDDAVRIMRTLERTVGTNNFHFIVAA